MHSRQPRRAAGSLIALIISLVLALSACSGQTQSVVGGGDDDDKSVTIGYVPFDEGIATSYLWKDILEKQGYTVQLQQLEVATSYQGLASGQIDLFFTGAPLTHKDYWDRFGKDFQPVGQWYDTLLQGVAVPTYTGLKTMSDLQGKASMFNGEIVGIEAGSGLMRQTTEDAPKVYDLSGYQVREAGTPAMLAALDRAISQQQPIAVTLWQPHWAFQRYELTLLEDDKDAYPDNDVINVVASKAFAGNTPVVEQLGRFHMDEVQLQSLELMILDAGQGNEPAAVRQWIEQNQAVVDGWSNSGS
jgi:glycine betaine/proline transport system substrate-binding protein